MHRLHTVQNVVWTECSGWRIPASFGDPAEEARRATLGVGLQDVSPLGKLDLKGTALDGRVAGCERLTGVAAALSIKAGHAMLLTEPGREEDVRRALPTAVDRSRGCLHVTELTSALAAFALVGPQAADVLSRVTTVDLRPERFRNRCSAPCDLAHVHATVHRSDWGALPAYLLLVGRDVGEYVWSTLHDAGARLGLTPFGVAAEQLLKVPVPARLHAPASLVEHPIVSPTS